MSTDDYAALNALRWAEAVPDISPDAALLAVRFMRVADALASSQTASLAPWRIDGVTSVDDFRTIAMIRLAPPPGVRPSEIAKALGSANGTISNRLDRLDRHGWISRSANGEDKRSQFLSVPKAKQAAVDEMYRALVANHRSFFASLDTKTEQAMIDGLAHLMPQSSAPGS